MSNGGCDVFKNIPYQGGREPNQGNQIDTIGGADIRFLFCERTCVEASDYSITLGPQSGLLNHTMYYGPLVRTTDQLIC